MQLLEDESWMEGQNETDVIHPVWSLDHLGAI